MSESDVLGPQRLDCETWRETVRSLCGRYNPEGIDPEAFVGWVTPVSVYGFGVLDIGCNAGRIERTCRDVRLDGADHYFAVFQVAGRSAMEHNGQAVRLVEGDVALVDAARPARYVATNGGAPWHTVTLDLPRESLISHLGFEPRGGMVRCKGTPAGRILFELIRNGGGSAGPTPSPADSYMHLAVFDLVGALFAPSEPWPASRHTEKMFARIRALISDRFADPDFGPAEVAAEARISLRYVHKLFAERDLTCNEFIYSLRLQHAARLLQRRAALGTDQPLSDIAYACGFRDYSHFARKFRQRFGTSPGAEPAEIMTPAAE